MTPGNVEFVQVVASMTVNTGAVAAILHADGRRLFGRFDPATGWLPSTREAAVLGAFLFGWLYGGPALVVHFVKSRRGVHRTLVGLGLGLLAAVAVVAADIAAQLAAAAAIDGLGL